MYNNHIYDKDFQEGFENGGLKGHVDLKRLREGLSGGAFWSVFAPCPTNDTDYSDENYASGMRTPIAIPANLLTCVPAVQWTLSAIDLMTRVQDRYSSEFSQQLDSSGAMKAFRKGKLISPLGVEGLHQIGNKVSNLRLYRDLGVRYATLTHNCHNNFADAALVGVNPEVAKPKWGGVSPLGQRVVHEMNRIGMIVDLAHVR
jgi:membrane dipeptidase